MKKVISAVAALGLAMGASASVDLVATGADVRTWDMAAADGISLSGFTVPTSRTLCPWAVYVTNAVKRAQSTESVFTPTNYIVTAQITATNSVPVWADFTNSVTSVVFQTDAATTNLAYAVVTNVYTATDQRLSLTNVIATATVTNAVGSLSGLSDLWTCIATNGTTSVVTNYTTAAAGGTVTLSTSYGGSWSISLSDGCGFVTNEADTASLVFPGDLKLTASQAERLTLRMVYLTFQR